VNPRIFPVASLLFVSLSLAGCRRAAGDTPAQANLERAHQIEIARNDLGQIPPPSKNLYMNAHGADSWENPLLTVQQNMITISILEADANPSDLGKGTMLRPIAARKQILNIRPDHLAEALNAIPHSAWPYGRVVAIEEAHDAPTTVRPQLRRNIESAMQTLSDIGVVADEWNNDRPVGIR
jgi:hypothetical protein